MKVPVLIEATPEHRYRARGGEPFLVDIIAETPAEALQKVKELIEQRMAEAVCLAELEVSPENPWLSGAGMFCGDPLFDAWQDAIANYRRSSNEEASTK